ncbi:glycoside hydrolase 5 family protein [Flavobacterium sp. TMP13]|uniref:glycoside hydrolase 5 family protein n=1 Tax=Flavobacterium sp. TMP13 TaxID=3425950 RepID=UPI003D789E82
MKNGLLKLSGLFLLSIMISCQAQEKITVKGTQFYKGDKQYAYIGTNYWYGSMLASKKIGDRKRLLRELDLMQKNGIDNLRILVGAEGGKYDMTARPALQYEEGKYDEDLLDGLDFLLAEMGKRKMYAVLYLTNNWEWSGGLAQYLEWNGKGVVPVPNVNGVKWSEFMNYTEQFHSCEPCMESLNNYVRFIIARTNTYTNKKYIDDNTIMAWQVANEPRPLSQKNEVKFNTWINTIVDLIKTLDPNHLVSTGSEGKAGSNDSIDVFEKSHLNPNIDYLTMHIWPKNWRWFDANDAEKTMPVALENAKKYIDEHIEVATTLNRPIIVEEFGLPRDHEKLTVGTAVKYRDIFYDYVFSRVLESKNNNGPLQGANFWGFGGEGKAVNPEGKWNPGDPLTTDPPQEPQGFNSVFSGDTSTLKIIKKHNDFLKK